MDNLQGEIQVNLVFVAVVALAKSYLWIGYSKAQKRVRCSTWRAFIWMITDSLGARHGCSRNHGRPHVLSLSKHSRRRHVRYLQMTVLHE